MHDAEFDAPEPPRPPSFGDSPSFGGFPAMDFDISEKGNMPFKAPNMGDAFGGMFSNDIFSNESPAGRIEMSEMAPPVAP